MAVPSASAVEVMGTACREGVSLGPCQTERDHARPATGARYGITVPFDGVRLAEHRRWYEDWCRLGYTDVWSAETDGTDGFTPLALAAAWAPSLQLGVAIIPAYTRGPALLAQSVAAMAEAAPGRFTLGLGTSSDVIVDAGTASRSTEPYKRVRDTVRFLRAALAGEKVDEEYDTFAVRGFRLARPVEHPPPHLPGRAAPRDAPAGRAGGRRGHHQLAVGRRRGHGGARGRGRHRWRPGSSSARPRTPRRSGPSAGG